MTLQHLSTRSRIWFGTSALLYLIFITCVLSFAFAGYTFVAILFAIPAFIAAWLAVSIANETLEGLEERMKEYLDE